MNQLRETQAAADHSDERARRAEADAEEVGRRNCSVMSSPGFESGCLTKEAHAAARRRVPLVRDCILLGIHSAHTQFAAANLADCQPSSLLLRSRRNSTRFEP